MWCHQYAFRSLHNLEVQRSTPTPSFNLELNGGNLVEEKARGPRPRHPRRRLYVHQQLTVCNVKLDRKRFRLSKDAWRHHGAHGAQSLAAERGRASDRLAEMVYRGRS